MLHNTFTTVRNFLNYISHNAQVSEAIVRLCKKLPRYLVYTYYRHLFVLSNKSKVCVCMYRR